jgi:hypothetical protein
MSEYYARCSCGAAYGWSIGYEVSKWRQAHAQLCTDMQRQLEAERNLPR